MGEELKTSVVGAGPAGLMFVLVGKILMGDAWKVELFDKRDTYVRTHRLGMAPEPYLAIQRDLADPRFDVLVAFLEEHHFSPEVNRLEAVLSELLAEMGVKKVVREIARLDELEGDTIVGADSVHSTIRELVRGPLKSQKHTHERVARLRAVGSDLPERLNVVDQFRLSKVLGSVVDYRRNANGFAEIDLFLTEDEHAIVKSLGATPKDPIAISSKMLGKLKAPLMRAIVEHLEHGDRKILLQSTFLLEHEVMPKVSFEVSGKRVFLVGDAGVSLPFFRGMACLASSAHALARVHATRAFGDYDAAVAGIVAREVAVVRSRARVVRSLRELIRLSSLLPFPIQSWWLSAAHDPEPDKMSAGTYFNAVVAIAATATIALGFLSPALSLLSLPVQLCGGIAYRWTLDLEAGPHRYLRRIWEVQIAVVAIAGAVLAARGIMAWPVAGLWMLLGVAFALGIYAFEAVIARPLRKSDL